MSDISYVNLPDGVTYNITDLNALHHITVPDYDSTSTYNLGDFVTYNGNIYICITAIATPEAWNSSHWRLVDADQSYLHSLDPKGAGSFSLNRKANTTIGFCSFAEGYNCTASKKYSHAEGYETTASGERSHAEGADTTASGYCSHAEGEHTTASGTQSHAEGLYSKASGDYSSHAEGYATTASGLASHAEGYYTTANHYAQHVFGQCNVIDPSTATALNRGNYIEIVGNGTSTSAPSNARTLDWSGNEVLSGGLTSASVSTTTLSATTLNGVTIGSSPKFTDNNTTYTLGTNGNNVTLTPSSGSVQSITVPYATSAYSATTATGATSAGKWTTARNLTIGNTAKSVNGSADVSFPNPLKIGYCGSDSAGTSGWYRVMTVSQSGYTDTNLNLLITSGYSKNASGILHVHVRCNNGTANVLQSLCWITRIGWGINEAYFKDHGNNTWSLYVYQANTQYGRVQVQILTETGTAASQQNITLLNNNTRESSLSGGTNSWESTIDASANFTVSGNFQSVTKKLFDRSGVVELFMTGNVKTAIADNATIFTVPNIYKPKVNDSGFTFFTGTDQYIPTGMKFGYFTYNGNQFHTLGALSVGTQVTAHFTYLV